MSVQAMSWALSLPIQSLKDSSARHVLLCLANYAGTDGRGAFPSATTLADDTGLSERTVRSKLEILRASGLIIPGNQALAAVYIERHDRRPVVYDLPIKRGANSAPRTERGAEKSTGCNSQRSGVQISAERGAKSAPNTPLNHQVTEEQLQQREIDAALMQQYGATIEAPGDHQRFAMFATWVPSEKALADQIAIAGLPADCVPDEAVRKFKGFHCAKPNTIDSGPGWCYRLVQWVRRERVQAAGRGQEPDFNDTSWGENLGDL